MSRRISSGTIVTLGVAITVFAWLAYIQFFNDERAIRRRMNDVASALSTSRESSDLARLQRVMQLRPYLAEDVRAVDRGSLELTSRDEVLAVAANWATLGSGLTANFVDLTVSVEPGGTAARSRFRAEVSGTDAHGTPRTEVREVSVELAKGDDGWIITAVDAVEP